MAEKIEVQKFRKLILDMHRGYPNWRYRGMVEQVIKTEKDRKRLVKSGVLIEENIADGKQYSLGQTGLLLVSSWKNEETSNAVKKLTLMLVILTVLIIVIMMYPSYFAAGR